MPMLASSNRVMAPKIGSAAQRPARGPSRNGPSDSATPPRWVGCDADSQATDEIECSLALGFRLLAAAESFAAAFAELGDIELPPVVGSEADQAALRAAAPLYLASELETASLLPAVEA